MIDRLKKLSENFEKQAAHYQDETEYYLLGFKAGKYDLETFGHGSDILASILAQRSLIPMTEKAWMDYATGYAEGSKMTENSYYHESVRMLEYLDRRKPKPKYHYRSRNTLSQLDPKTVEEGIVISLKGSSSEDIEGFLDDLTPRGLDLYYHGGDRYVVRKKK